MEACGEGWEANGDHCYLWNTGKKNWTAAEDFCLQEGGHLASVTSNATNDFVLEGMNRIGLARILLGGNDIEEEGAWKWTDCTHWEDTFWYPGEPNSAGAEDCLEMLGDIWVEQWSDWLDGPVEKVTRWNDKSCGTELGFVCSKKICSGRIPNMRKISVKTSRWSF